MLLPPEPRRVADLQLRGPDGPVRTRVWWPDTPDTHDAPAGGPRPALLAFFSGGDGDADAVCPRLCVDAGVVVLATLGDAAVGDAVAVVQWAADHAAELGADGTPLLLAGRGPGALLVAAVAEVARAEGWPPLRAVGPGEDGDDLAAAVRRARHENGSAA